MSDGYINLVLSLSDQVVFSCNCDKVIRAKTYEYHYEEARSYGSTAAAQSELISVLVCHSYEL